MTLLTEISFYIAAFAGCLITGYLIANALSKGFVWGITKVKVFGRRRGWVLVKVHTVSRPYYRTGVLKGDIIEYTPRFSKGPTGEKLKKTITVQKGSIEHNLGVDYIETDENTNNVLNFRDWKVVSGHDAELVNGLMRRIAMLPKSVSKTDMWILIGIAIVVIMVGYNIYQTIHVQSSVNALTAVYQNATARIGANVGNLPQ